ncbi:hypothetical protein GCM10027413_23290 [Conyzicola nivalis]|uniref:DUF7144 domain-containing protein n=1 Tax=Conyzicola nivalis TaxID=1477021 RepID=A0A916WF66_9MICO|nr:hypothetical protein [Conyzicola nivalis]GGA91985.1 hypothetical protein GCM10010979_03330 [Conyzicola nivalis]
MSNATGYRSGSGWTDWVRFAGVILIVGGIFNLIQGLAALLGPDAYFGVVNGELLVFNVEGWGWWNVLIGALTIPTGIALFGGATWARIVAVVLAVASAIVQMILVPVQPWWSFIVIGIDVLIIYAIVAHGKDLRDQN